MSFWRTFGFQGSPTNADGIKDLKARFAVKSTFLERDLGLRGRAGPLLEIAVHLLVAVLRRSPLVVLAQLDDVLRVVSPFDRVQLDGQGLVVVQRALLHQALQRTGIHPYRTTNAQDFHRRY